MTEAPKRIWAEPGMPGYLDTPSDLYTVEYVRADRIEELEAKLDWVIVERDETFALMLDRAQTAEAKLAKAVEALELLHRNVVHAWPSVADLGPVANARTTLAELMRV